MLMKSDNLTIVCIFHMFKAGVIRGFWSVNPLPHDDGTPSIKTTPGNGFIRMDSVTDLEKSLDNMISKGFEFFSSMKTKHELGQLIEISDKELSLEKKAEKFLSLIRL